MPNRPRRDPLRHPGRRGSSWVVPACPDEGDPLDLALSFTPTALWELIQTVGARPPESGAKLFGPVERFGVDLVEFDEVGSAAAGGAVYSPDTDWGSERLAHWISQRGEDQRIWTGDAHSHPGGFGWPSRRSGPGLGDLGYVEAVFEQNEVQFEFCIPILTHTGAQPSALQIHPWVVLRDEPLRPRWARFELCHVPAFPQRRFNPAFEHHTEAGRSASVLDLDLLADLLRARFGDHVVLYEDDGTATVDIDFGDAVVQLDLGTPDSITATVMEGLGTGIRSGDAAPRASIERRANAAAAAAADAAAAVPSRRRTATRTDHRSSVEPAAADRPLCAEPTTVDLPAGEAPATVDRTEYYARTQGLLSEGFHDRSVLVVGTSGGSYLVEKLARLGPRRLVLADPDVVEVPNLVRTAFRTDQVGMPKVAALASSIATINPYVTVKQLAVDITTLQEGAIRALLADIDLIIAGTDSFEAQATLNRWSQSSGVPAVFIGVHESAAGGIVRWSVPGETACYRCMAAGRYEAAASGDRVDLPGAAGLLIDVQSIDMVAASVAVGLLDRGAPTPKGRLIDALGDRTELVISTTPEYEWGQELFRSLTSDLPAAPDRESDLATYLGVLPLVAIPVRRNPHCPDCGEPVRQDVPPGDADAGTA